MSVHHLKRQDGEGGVHDRDVRMYVCNTSVALIQPCPQVTN